jgi:hypothetical protein
MSLEFQVRRNPSDPVCTIGNQWYREDNGEWARLCWTLEDVIREVPGVPVATWKVLGQTAIPAGTYRMVKSFSQKFGKVLPEILQVPGFAYIRQHGGNRAKDTEGFTILATEHPSADVVSECKEAVQKVLDLLDAHGGEATIQFLNPGDWP